MPCNQRGYSLIWQNSWLEIGVGAANKTFVASFKGKKKTHWLSVSLRLFGTQMLATKDDAWNGGGLRGGGGGCVTAALTWNAHLRKRGNGPWIKDVPARKSWCLVLRDDAGGNGLLPSNLWFCPLLQHHCHGSRSGVVSRQPSQPPQLFLSPHYLAVVLQLSTRSSWFIWPSTACSAWPPLFTVFLSPALREPC